MYGTFINYVDLIELIILLLQKKLNSPKIIIVIVIIIIIIWDNKSVHSAAFYLL
jgi:hypothetical protein